MKAFGSTYVAALKCDRAMDTATLILRLTRKENKLVSDTRKDNRVNQMFSNSSMTFLIKEKSMLVRVQHATYDVDIIQAPFADAVHAVPC